MGRMINAMVNIKSAMKNIENQWQKKLGIAGNNVNLCVVSNPVRKLLSDPFLIKQDNC